LKKKSLKISKWIIRSRKSKKDRQNNGPRKQDKKTNNDLQNITQKTKDRATRTLLKTGGELGCSGWFERTGSLHPFVNILHPNK